MSEYGKLNLMLFTETIRQRGSKMMTRFEVHMFLFFTWKMP